MVNGKGLFIELCAWYMKSSNSSIKHIVFDATVRAFLFYIFAEVLWCGQDLECMWCTDIDHRWIIW